eukprot:8450678-Pyramimonas_sp.AAC.1
MVSRNEGVLVEVKSDCSRSSWRQYSRRAETPVGRTETHWYDMSSLEASVRPEHIVHLPILWYIVSRAVWPEKAPATTHT